MQTPYKNIFAKQDMATFGQRAARFLTDIFRVCFGGSLCGRLLQDEVDNNVTVNLRTNIKCCNSQRDVVSTEDIQDVERQAKSRRPSSASKRPTGSGDAEFSE